jgi:D-beta-D-heptose 7-phosphate kinase/D-beta-D-heptose 1-phosphate adenosyltransferase
MEQRLQQILASFPGKRILVAGDVMLDEYVWGDVRRISPEAPVPVVEIRRRTHVPGGAGNTAVNILSLGGKAVLGAVVGPDHQAGQLREQLQQRGVDAGGLVVDPGRMTTTKTRIVAHMQQVVRIDAEQRGPAAAAVEDRLLEWARRQVGAVDACVLSDYAKGVVTPRFAQQYIALARQAGRPVVVDPKGTDYAKYRGATVVKPNVHEAERVCKCDIDSDAALDEAGRQLLDLLDGSALLITRGPQGMSLFQAGAPPAHIPSFARDVFDVTGAGDTVAGTLAMALAAKAALPDAALLANRAAGIVVGKLGTATVSAAELSAALSGTPAGS